MMTDKERRARNAEKARRSYAKHREKRLEASRAWKAANKERVSQYRSAYFVENADQERENRSRWRSKNLERARELNTRWRNKNRDAINAKSRSVAARAVKNEKARIRYFTNPDYRLRCCLRASLTQALRLGKAGKRCSVFHLIGCSTTDLMLHLERQFSGEMSWDNAGSAWVVDHIRPCASFDLTSLEEQKRCFHFTNLRPLCPVKNMQKSDRLELLL